MGRLKVDTIQDAYSQLRISGLTVNPTPSDLETALVRLENMMAELSSRNICTGYNAEDEPDPNSVTNVERYAWQMMATNLAVRLIPDFNKDVPMALNQLATASMSSVSAISAKKALCETPYPSRQPRGSGSTLRYNRWQRFYRPTETAPANCETKNIRFEEVADMVEHFGAYLNKSELIDSYTFDAGEGITIQSDSNTGTDINYRVFIPSTSNNTGTFQQVKITVTTDQGRTEIRYQDFNIEE